MAMEGGKGQWMECVQGEEGLSKGDGMAFHYKEEVLNYKCVQGKEVVLKGNEKVFNCIEDALNWKPCQNA